MTSTHKTRILSTLVFVAVGCCLIQTAIQVPIKPEKLTKDYLKFIRTYPSEEYDFIILDN